MHIVCLNNNGTKYLQVQESYSIKVEGLVKTRKRAIRNIGPLAKFDDGKPDFLKRLRESFKAGTPIIESLADLAGQTPAEMRVNLSFDLSDENICFSTPRNIGYFLLDAIYDALGICNVLWKQKSQTKIEYDLNGIAKLLVFERILAPGSKFEAFQGRDRYLFDIASSGKLSAVYRALDVLDATAGMIQKRINHRISNSVGRNMEVCFYDVTNYYFEIGENDADDFDDTTGAVVREGLRKRGVSKEKRSEPIVQMGLFMDDNGLPIAYRLFPGNRVDQTTLRPALEKDIDKLRFERIVIVADGGLNSDKNIARIVKSGNGYILSKSTKKSDKRVKKWILEEEGYEWNETRTFKEKSQIRERDIVDEDGQEQRIKEKLVCFWSRRHYERALRENAKFLEYLDDVIKNPAKLKNKPWKIERFLKKETIDKRTGKPIKADVKLSIDMAKVQEYKDLMGYYTIMTSEVTKSDYEIIEKYHGLSRIEDSFRITKSDLEGRPVFVRTPEHINAHFLVCFIALTMIRLVQYRILQNQKEQEQAPSSNDVSGWKSGLSAERIQKALSNFNADALPQGYYRLTKQEEDLKLILESFGINGDLRLPTETKLRRFKSEFDNAVSKFLYN